MHYKTLRDPGFIQARIRTITQEIEEAVRCSDFKKVRSKQRLLHVWERRLREKLAGVEYPA